MGTAYKAALPGATVTVSPEAPCRGRAAAKGSSPRRHASPCAWQCWRSCPDKAERTRRGTSCQVARGFEARASRGHPAPAPPQHHGSRAGSSTHILPAEYAPVTHRNAGVAGGAHVTRSAGHRWSCHDLRQCLVAADIAPGIRALTRWPAALAMMPADRLMPSRAPPRPAGRRMRAAAPSSGPARRPRRGLRSGHPAQTGRHRVRRAG